MGVATGVLVGRLVQSANAIWLLSRPANSETIQEPNSETNNPEKKVSSKEEFDENLFLRPGVHGHEHSVGK